MQRRAGRPSTETERHTLSASHLPYVPHLLCPEQRRERVNSQRDALLSLKAVDRQKRRAASAERRHLAWKLVRPRSFRILSKVWGMFLSACVWRATAPA
eukprot:354289-Chlamydomonas_euryale.AAC.1